MLAALLLLANWWLYAPANPSNRKSVYVTVASGDTTGTVAAGLAARGLLHTPLGFILLAERRHWAGEVRPGTYRLSAAESPLAILTKMVKGQAINQISVTAGSTVSQVIDELVAHQLGTRSQYRQWQRQGLPGMPPKLKGTQDAREGFLFPATYALPRGATAEAAIQAMWTNFQMATQNLRRQLPAGWSIRKWVTLASIVQAEVKYPTDGPKVAAVFLNRLRKGMPLQSDATVYYALGPTPRGPLTLADLNTPSAYNTYIVSGLPPGPIDNPGMTALSSVLHPAHVNYLYFLTLPDGRAEFAHTYAEQVQHIDQLDRINSSK